MSAPNFTSDATPAVAHVQTPPNLNRELFEEDQQRLLSTQLPIITLSASFKEDLKRLTGFPDNDTLPDTVLSRAHYSMARGVAELAWERKGETHSPLNNELRKRLSGTSPTNSISPKSSSIDPRKAWIVDPLNHLTGLSWWQVLLTEHIGHALARQPLLKQLKTLIDRFGRQKIPLIETIRPVLRELVNPIDRPILSFHIAVGNILLELEKTVCQVITDPHVRDDYLLHASNPHLRYCVFDERTRSDVIERAYLLGHNLSPSHVIVTGPPVDPRVTAVRRHKTHVVNRPLRLCLATGGLGTNKSELAHILHQLLSVIVRQDSCRFELMLYAGTQQDVKHLAEDIARHHKIKISRPGHLMSHFRLLYHPQIMDANELLIKYAFPWADGFITKPSGDMAYDAIAAGCFLLTLSEWGEWEENIREVFEQKNVSRVALTHDIVHQIEALSTPIHQQESWIHQALQRVQKIDPLFLHGSAKIIEAYQDLAKKEEPLLE